MCCYYVILCLVIIQKLPSFARQFEIKLINNNFIKPFLPAMKKYFLIYK